MAGPNIQRDADADDDPNRSTLPVRALGTDVERRGVDAPRVRDANDLTHTPEGRNIAAVSGPGTRAPLRVLYSGVPDDGDVIEAEYVEHGPLGFLNPSKLGRPEGIAELRRFKGGVREGFVGNPSTPQDVLLAIAKGEAGYAKRRLAQISRNSNSAVWDALPEKLRAEIDADANRTPVGSVEDKKVSLFEDGRKLPRTQSELKNMQTDDRARLAAFGNDISRELEGWLSDDESAEVRAELAATTINDKILDKLLKDSDPMVRAFCLANKRVPIEMRRKVWGSGDSSPMERVCAALADIPDKDVSELIRKYSDPSVVRNDIQGLRENTLEVAEASAMRAVLSEKRNATSGDLHRIFGAEKEMMTIGRDSAETWQRLAANENTGPADLQDVYRFTVDPDHPEANRTEENKDRQGQGGIVRNLFNRFLPGRRRG